jgi:hypothetical protein
LVAGLAGIAVYYFEVKPGTARDEEPDKSKPLFSFNRDEIAAISITRGAETINLELQENKWLIKQPVNSAADETAMNQLVATLGNARIDSEFPASGDQLKQYGLAEPPVKLEIKLKNGRVDKLDLGGKDPLGTSAYGRLNGSPNVAMLPIGVFSSSDKSLNDFRDRSLLNANQYELSSLKVSNPNGGFELAKKDNDWVIKSPLEAPAEDTEVNNLLTEVTTAKYAEIVSETGEDAGKYGLNNSKIKFTVQTAAGTERTILVGSKVDDKYYAKIADRPQIVKIETSLYDKLNTKISTLRSKSFVKFNREEIATVQITNANVTLIAGKNDAGKWVVKEPADKKDKEVYVFKLFDPVENRATEIIDKPSGAIAAKLAKPAAEVRLTAMDGKVTVVKVSQPEGDSVYVGVEGKPEIYKVNKSMLDSLNFKIEDALVS